MLAYGDSNTAGDEITDHLALNVTFEECNAIKKSLTQAEFYKRYSSMLNAFWPETLSSSWAAHLAKRLSLPFVNNSLSGSSLNHICFAIYNDMLTRKITDDDLVLVGLPLLERDLFFENNTPYTLMFNSLPKSYLSLLDLYDNNKIVVEYFRSLLVLEGLSSRINIKIQPTNERTLFTDEDFSRLNISDDVYTFAKDVWKSSKIFIDKEDSLMEDPPDYIRCGYNHYRLESHVSLANRLYENYFK